MSRMPPHQLPEQRRRRSPIRTMGEIPVVKKQTAVGYTKTPTARPVGWRKQQYLVKYDHTLHVGTTKKGQLEHANIDSPRRSRGYGSRTPRTGHTPRKSRGDDAPPPPPPEDGEHPDLEDENFPSDAGGQKLHVGDQIHVYCPPDMYPPEHPTGVVTGHSSDRTVGCLVHVQLDNGLEKTVTKNELIPAEDFDDDDEEPEVADRWKQAFRIGDEVEVDDPPTGGDKDHGKMGVVTGMSRGRVGVNVGTNKAPRIRGFTEQELRHGDLEDEDEDGQISAKMYPVGVTVQVVDPSAAEHGLSGQVTGHARGRIGVALDNGAQAGLTVQQLVIMDDDEDPDLASRWKKGEQCMVYIPPTGGKDHGVKGVVTGYARGRIGIEVSGKGEKYSIGVAPRSLRRADGNAILTATIQFPLDSRVQVLGLDPTSLHGMAGVVTGIDYNRERVGVKLEDGTMHGLVANNLMFNRGSTKKAK